MLSCMKVSCMKVTPAKIPPKCYYEMSMQEFARFTSANVGLVCMRCVYLYTCLYVYEADSCLKLPEIPLRKVVITSSTFPKRKDMLKEKMAVSHRKAITNCVVPPTTQFARFACASVFMRWECMYIYVCEYMNMTTPKKLPHSYTPKKLPHSYYYLNRMNDYAKFACAGEIFFLYVWAVCMYVFVSIYMKVTTAKILPNSLRTQNRMQL